MTKKLEKLLLKYQKANRVRLTAYARRSRLTLGYWDNNLNMRVYKVKLTDELRAELDANIEKARLFKLEKSKELRAYCKKKKYHLQWGDSNNIIAVRSHLSWRMRKEPARPSANAFMKTIHALKLCSTMHHVY